MWKLTTTTLLLAGTFLYPALPAWAEAPKRLETVVVTAGRVEEKAKSVTASMTVIPQEEIKKKQYMELGGLLRNYGLQVDGYTPNGSLSRIAIRGMRSSAMGSDLQGSVLLLVDGRRVGTDNLSMIPMINIERVEVIRGPGAVQYGTSAIGGVVNVITKRGTTDLSAMAEVGGGSWNTYRTQGEVAWAKGPVDFSGGISHQTMDNYKTGSGKTYHNTGLDHKTAYSVSGGVGFWDEHRIGVTALGVRANDMGSPGYMTALQRGDYNDRSNESVDLTYEGGSKDTGLSWKGRYFNGRNEYLNDDHYQPRQADYFKSWTDYQGAQGQVSVSQGIVTLTGGMDWLNYKTVNKGFYYPAKQKSEYSNHGFFLLGKLSLLDERLIASSGVRYDQYTLEVQGKDRDLNRTTPSLGLAWHTTDWLTVRSNYGESYQIPDAIGLLGFTGMFTYLPNPGLKPEKGKTVDVGFDIDHNSLHLGLTYFRTNYKDKISTRFTPSWDSQYYNMDGTAKLRGLEAQASYDIGEAMEWPVMVRPYINMTRMLKNSDHQGKKVPYVSDLDVAYGLNFQYPDIGLDVDLRFTYYGHQDVQDWNTASPTYGKVVRFGGDTTADLFVTQQIWAWEKAGSLSVNAEVRNLFDKDYALTKGYPQPGRSYYLGLRYDY